MSRILKSSLKLAEFTLIAARRRVDALEPSLLIEEAVPQCCPEVLNLYVAALNDLNRAERHAMLVAARAVCEDEPELPPAIHELFMSHR